VGEENVERDRVSGRISTFAAANLQNVDHARTRRPQCRS